MFIQLAQYLLGNKSIINLIQPFYYISEKLTCLLGLLKSVKIIIIEGHNTGNGFSANDNHSQVGE